MHGHAYKPHAYIAGGSDLRRVFLCLHRPFLVVRASTTNPRRHASAAFGGYLIFAALPATRICTCRRVLGCQDAAYRYKP